MRLKSFAAGILLLVAATMHPFPSRSECILGMTTAMPLRQAAHHFVVTASINGHDSDLFLDTGAFVTTVTFAAAARLGLKPIRYPGEAYGIGGSQQLYTAIAPTMRIGRMKADGTTLAVSRMGGVETKRLDQDGAEQGGAETSGAETMRSDGLFGMNMMSHYDIDLDVVGQKAVLFQADGTCAKPTVTLGPELYAVKLEDVVRDEEAVVTVTVDGHRLRAMLDTGAPQTAMFRRAAMRLGVDLSALHDSRHETMNGMGDLSIPAFRHVFKTVEIGSLSVQNMPIEILAQRDTGIDHHHIGSLLENEDGDDAGAADMLLGADFMQKVHLWISHSSHTLVMQYPPKASPPLPKG